jgi:hypothetical protein
VPAPVYSTAHHLGTLSILLHVYCCLPSAADLCAWLNIQLNQKGKTKVKIWLSTAPLSAADTQGLLLAPRIIEILRKTVPLNPVGGQCTCDVRICTEWSVQAAQG